MLTDDVTHPERCAGLMARDAATVGQAIALLHEQVARSWRWADLVEHLVAIAISRGV